MSTDNDTSFDEDYSNNKNTKSDNPSPLLVETIMDQWKRLFFGDETTTTMTTTGSRRISIFCDPYSLSNDDNDNYNDDDDNDNGVEKNQKNKSKDNDNEDITLQNSTTQVLLSKTKDVVLEQINTYATTTSNTKKKNDDSVTSKPKQEETEPSSSRIAKGKKIEKNHPGWKFIFGQKDRYAVKAEEELDETNDIVLPKEEDEVVLAPTMPNVKSDGGGVKDLIHKWENGTIQQQSPLSSSHPKMSPTALSKPEGDDSIRTNSNENTKAGAAVVVDRSKELSFRDVKFGLVLFLVIMVSLVFPMIYNEYNYVDVTNIFWSFLSKDFLSPKTRSISKRLVKMRGRIELVQEGLEQEIKKCTEFSKGSDHANSNTGCSLERALRQRNKEKEAIRTQGKVQETRILKDLETCIFIEDDKEAVEEDKKACVEKYTGELLQQQTMVSNKIKEMEQWEEKKLAECHRFLLWGSSHTACTLEKAKAQIQQLVDWSNRLEKDWEKRIDDYNASCQSNWYRREKEEGNTECLLVWKEIEKELFAQKEWLDIQLQETESLLNADDWTYDCQTRNV